ncbi:hypothetical protein K1X76_00930 [bacterium]|nr:hypothetical protein [bacterium]
MKNALKLMLVCVWFTLFSGQLCTKVMVYGKDFNSVSTSAVFRNGRTEILEAVQKGLEALKYQVTVVDAEAGSVKSGWKPVEVDSHYFNLFERRDYGGADGAYYKMNVDLIEQGDSTKVVISTTVKSLIGRLESTGNVERRLKEYLEDALRSPNIEMTNVGVKNR